MAIENYNPVWIPVSDELPTGMCLAVYKTSPKKYIIIKAFYAKEFQIQQDYDEFCDLDYCDATGDYYLTEGWYESISCWCEYSSASVCDGEITHWIPMPKLPPL